MIVGNRERFAIEAEVGDKVDDWVFGRFRFWLCGHAVGNWSDAADLKGCVAWLRTFANTTRDRFEPAFEGMAAREIFRLAFDSVMAGSGIASDEQAIPNAYSRFNITRLGMSSFDNVALLLVKDRNGGERCLWREHGSTEIGECALWRNEMETVAAQFCDAFELECKS